MNLVFSVNAASQDIRWGDPASGSLSTLTPLGFSCVRMAVFPGQRYVYVSGSKPVGAETHAWLAVLDTCSGTVVSEVDLGAGFAGQVAVPGGVGGGRAFVAISQAVGTIDAGPGGGGNRIAVLNTNDPAQPVLLNPAIAIPGGNPFGTLHIVWSIAKNRLYTTHRGSGNLYAIDPLAGAATLVTNLPLGPTGLALTQNQTTLLVGRRSAGDIVAFDLSGPAPIAGDVLPLPNGVSGSAIYLTVDAQDRVIATSAQRIVPPGSNPNPNPNPGLVYLFELQGPNPLVAATVDVQGSWLGQPAVAPDGSRVFVPRGDQNDLVEIDLANHAVNGLVAVGHSPLDCVAVDHVAGERLEATPNPVTTPCDAPVEVTVRAFDACGVERMGVPVRPTTFASNVNVVNVVRNTPARYEVQCTGNGPATISFTTFGVFPITTTTLDVGCECLTDYCVDFSLFNGGPLPGSPGDLGGVIQVTVINAGIFQGPEIFGTELFMRHGSVRFRMPPGLTVQDLLVRYTRHDALSQPESVIVTHAAGSTVVGNPTAGLHKGDHEIVCLFRGIREWTIAAGAESRIRQICFRAPAGIAFVVEPV